MNSKKNNKSLEVLITICAIILSGLGVLATIISFLTQNQLQDRSILTGFPCAPPCWQGITPGITNDQEALEILQMNSLIKRGSINPAGSSLSGGCTWEWRTSWKWIDPGISWKNGVVDIITLGLTFNLTVNEVIEKFGIPEYVSISDGGIPEHWYWIIDLYYPSKGILFTAYTREYSNKFYPSTEIGAAFLFVPTTMEEMPERIQSSHYEKWKGYGDASGLYGSGRQWPQL
jgi:hypothetical protein